MVNLVAVSVAGLAGIVTFADPTKALRSAAFIVGLLFIVAGVLGGALHS